MNSEKLILAGGSGFLGQALAKHFRARGSEVVVFTRRGGTCSQSAREVIWDGETPGDWVRELEGAAAVINLAGRSVNCRYTAANRRDIMNSRFKPTRALGRAIAQCTSPPRVWLNASSATIYRHTFAAPGSKAHSREAQHRMVRQGRGSMLVAKGAAH
jgi:NAD dependent epimerase/dehydratase family enzyme